MKLYKLILNHFLHFKVAFIFLVIFLNIVDLCRKADVADPRLFHFKERSVGRDVDTLRYLLLLYGWGTNGPIHREPVNYQYTLVRDACINRSIRGQWCCIQHPLNRGFSSHLLFPSRNSNASCSLPEWPFKVKNLVKYYYIIQR